MQMIKYFHTIDNQNYQFKYLIDFLNFNSSILLTILHITRRHIFRHFSLSRPTVYWASVGEIKNHSKSKCMGKSNLH